MKRSSFSLPHRLRWAHSVFGAVAMATLAAASPVPSKTKITKPTLYVVGYSHLDTQWCWSYPQVIREFIPNTLHENFALFKQFPHYVFNWTGSNRYRFMKEYYPADYATLKKYVAEGKWFPAGSSIEEGDVNSPSEESLIRQVMYGNEFFNTEFGVSSSEFMLPDCFGFPASLPSILAHCGLKGFSTQKLTWGSAVGIPFNVGKWVGPDGRYIIAALNPDSYTSEVRTDLDDDPNWINRLQEDVKNDGVGVDYHYYGVGDRGGAPDPESVKFVQASISQSGPIKVYAGRADQMFNDLTSDEVQKLPEYKGDLELTQHSAGSLSSEGAQKRWNRKNELLASDAESASVAANWLGATPYDKSRITDAWLRFLPGQFHDLMAGTALPVAYNYTWNDEILAMNEFAGVIQNSVGAVSRALDTRVTGVPLTVYNPLSIARDDAIEATVRFPGEVPINLQVFDSSGQRLPTQIVSRSEKSATVLFTGKVPSLGYSVFDVRPAAAETEATGELKVSDHRLENSRYVVKIDPAGDVSSVYDKLNQKELLQAPARLAYMHENPSQFPAWNMDWSDQKMPPRAYVTGPASFKIVEEGPVRVAVQVTRRSEGSKFVQTLRLGSGDAADRLDFVTQIDWQGRESALKAEFPLTVSNPKATYNWGLGTVMRGNDEPKKYEVASHGWIDLTNEDKSYGASILDDCKYGSDKPNDNTLRLTLIYTPGVRGGYQHQATQDWGRNVMTYSLMGHTDTWEKAGTQWDSAELNQPLIAFQTDRHPGIAGPSWSLATSSSKDVSLESVKQAEKGDEVVVRLNELAGASHQGVKIKFAAPILSAREIDGQERTIGKANISNGQLDVDMTPYEPRAFALKLGKSASGLAPAASTSLDLPYNLVGISSGFAAHDGNFDNAGYSIPGDMLPSKIVSNGITFVTGPKGKKNVLAMDGQTLRLPAGTHRRLYILGASAGADTNVAFTFGNETREAKLQSWDGYIGQWDSRQWGGGVPELAYDWHNPMVGLVPGYIKREPVAWYADHKRDASGGDDIYAFCYLFKTSVPIPDGAQEVTLVKNPEARIAALTVSDNPADEVRPAQPLYDVFNHQDLDGPSISVADPIPGAEKIVTIEHPLYWSGSTPIRYTMDGSAPTPTSALYRGPFAVGASGLLTVGEVTAEGKVVSLSKKEVQVQDSTPATVVGATDLPDTNVIKVEFSEPVDPASAEDPGNYAVSTGDSVSSAKLAEDGKTLTLSLSSPVPANSSLTVKGVKDFGGLASNSTVDVKPLQPVYVHDEAMTFDGNGRGYRQTSLPNLPTAGKSHWTINMFVKMDRQAGDLTILGGFGSGQDEGGAERFIIENDGHIYFWGSNVDIDSGVPYDLNRWQMITATYDGKVVRLYKDGKEIKSDAAELNDAVNMVRLATPPAWENGHRFAGSIAGMTVWNEALSPSFLATLTAGAPKS